MTHSLPSLPFISLLSNFPFSFFCQFNELYISTLSLPKNLTDFPKKIWSFFVHPWPMSTNGRFKELLKKYSNVTLGVHFTISAPSLLSQMALFKVYIPVPSSSSPNSNHVFPSYSNPNSCGYRGWVWDLGRGGELELQMTHPCWRCRHWRWD